MSLLALDDLKVLDDISGATSVAMDKFVEEKIHECMENPALASDPIVHLAVRWGFHNKPMHQCYWNDRFVIAVLCNLSLFQKRLSAWCVVSNGLNRYFEWITHYDYSMAKAFRRLGMQAGVDFPTHAGDHGYTGLHHGIVRDLISIFNLPTLCCNREKELTEADRQDAKYFEKQYPYTNVL